MSSACSVEQVIAPAVNVGPRPRIGSAQVGILSSAKWAVTSANVNKCSEGTALRDQNGLFVGWNRQERKVVSGADASQADVVEYRMMRFDANRRQTQDIQCVLPKSESSKNFVKHYFKNRIGGALSSGSLLASSLSAGLECWM